LKKGWKILFLNYLSEARHLDENAEYSFFMNKGYSLLRKGLELKKRWLVNSTVVFNEKYFRIPFNSKFVKDVFISGKLDLAIKNNDDDIYTIIDWKTGKNVDKNIETNDQITIYIYYISQQLKVGIENIFGALVYPQADDILFTQRKEEDIQRILSAYDAMLERIAEGDFKKEPLLNKKKDDCVFCPFIKRCKKYEF
jgi:CRISPR/Cas system-associated exonuclease Cas4 (RecB family)